VGYFDVGGTVNRQRRSRAGARLKAEQIADGLVERLAMNFGGSHGVLDLLEVIEKALDPTEAPIAAVVLVVGKQSFLEAQQHGKLSRDQAADVMRALFVRGWRLAEAGGWRAEVSRARAAIFAVDGDDDEPPGNPGAREMREQEGGNDDGK
jgi:hypothetical protein